MQIRKEIQCLINKKRVKRIIILVVACIGAVAAIIIAEYAPHDMETTGHHEKAGAFEKFN